MQATRHTPLALLAALSLAACQGTGGLAMPGESRIIITAEPGSEVVLNKHVGDAAADDLPAADTPAPTAARPESVAPAATPAPAPAPSRLGELRREPWRVHSGEALFDAVSRFATRTGRTALKDEPYPVWEITAAAAFNGEFEAALEWLMDGFGHVSPRPVLSLHPNGILRLAAE